VGANQTYKRTRKEIDALTKMMANALWDLDRRQAFEPNNWGYAGNAEHAREQLIQVIAFTMNYEPEHIRALMQDVVKY